MDQVKQAEDWSAGWEEETVVGKLLNMMVRSGLTERRNMNKNLKQVREFAYSLWSSGRTY